MDLKDLASLLIMLIVCAHSLPPERLGLNGIDRHEAFVTGNEEQQLAISEHQKQQYHIEASKKKFFLNPAKLPHIVKAKKANKNFKAHSDNVHQLALAATQGGVKVTRSKSGKKLHYEAVRF